MRTPPLTRCVGIAFALALASSPLLAEGARIVNAPDLPPFTNLQEAVDAATDGDTILVAQGSYEGFTIDNKALSIVAVPIYSVNIHGTVRILNLTAERSVLLSNLKVTGLSHPGVSDPALIVQSSLGHVRVQGCKLVGAAGWYTHVNGPFVVGGTGSSLKASSRVAFTHCTISGGAGSGDINCDSGCTGGAGGTGVLMDTSTAAFYECSIRGGAGGDGNWGGDGRDGCRLQGSWMFAAGSDFLGGEGGDGHCLVSIGTAGDGGAGLFLEANARAEWFDDSYLGGAGGIGWFCGTQGQFGPAKDGPGTLTRHPGTLRDLEAYALAFDNSTLAVIVHGTPGDQVWMQAGIAPAFQYQPSLPGVHLLQSGHVIHPAQVIPSSGSLWVELHVPDLTAGPERILYVQCVGRDVLGFPWLSSPLHVLALDREAPPDCNGNAQSDLADVLLAFSGDCGPNLVPDECDPDCDGNGFPDDCDLNAGTYADCNSNGVPDPCDLAFGASRDCNGNGQPDECDIATGASLDKNANSIPDECEPRTIWWVDAAALGGGNGSSSAPFQTIANAMDAAIDGDEIVLRDGTYSGPGNRDVRFRGCMVTVRSENGPSGCVLDLQSIGRAFLVDLDPGPGPVIEGLTFINGASYGGGALKITSSYPVIRHCVFESCLSTAGGGAILIESSGGLIEDCVFRDNLTPTYLPAAHEGGAIRFTGEYFELAEGHIVRCLFQGNSSANGGAICSSGYFPLTVSHCTFLENVASLSGGAIANRSSDAAGAVVRVDDCLFSGNRAGDDGGAIWAAASPEHHSTQMHLSGSTFVANQAIAEGGAAAIQAKSFTRIENCICWGNQAAFGAQLALNNLGHPEYKPVVEVERSDMQGAIAAMWSIGGSLIWAAGNLDIDPHFADPDGPDNDPLTFFDNDYRPIAGSPVDDAGDNSLVPPDVNDIDGDGNTLEPTPLDLDLTRRFIEDLLAPNVGAGIPPLIDMGCYEHP